MYWKLRRRSGLSLSYDLVFDIVDLTPILRTLCVPKVKKRQKEIANGFRLARVKFSREALSSEEIAAFK